MRSGEVRGALAKFVEQPRVLDSDNGLGGEVRDQADVTIRKRASTFTVNPDCADHLIVLEHRNAQHRPNSAQVNSRNALDSARDRHDRPSRLRCEQPVLSARTPAESPVVGVAWKTERRLALR